MADNEHKEFVTEWQNKIKFGMEYRKAVSTEKRWDDYRKMYRGDWKEGMVPINKIFSYGRSLIPRTYFRTPRIIVTPLRPDLTAHARVMEAIDNQLVQETDLKRTIKRTVLNTYHTGTGVVKLGYDSEYGFLPEQAVDKDTSTVTQESTRTEGRRIEYRTNVKPGMPWALPVTTEDIVVPYGYIVGNDLPWVAHYIVRPLKDVLADQKYTNTKDLKGTKGQALKGRKPDYNKVQFFDKDQDYAEIWEVRDWADNQIYAICENTLILADEDVLQFEGLPYEFLIFNDDPEHFWGIPDIKMLEELQNELNETSSIEARHRKIALLKFLYKRGAIKEEELSKFFSGIVGPGVAVEDDVEDITRAIHLLQPHVPPELPVQKRSIAMDMQEVLGFSNNQMGEFSPYHGKSATESMIVNQAFEARSDERKDLVADLVCNVVRKWNQMIIRLWDTERIIEIAGPEGGSQWVQYTGQQLEGEYLIKVDIESGMPMTSQSRLQAALQLFDKLNGDPRIDQFRLMNILLEAAATFVPQAPMLPSQMPPQMAQQIGAMRQPQPMGTRGQQGGQKGTMAQKPEQLEKVAARMKGST